jgi:hypothetical protein
MTLPDICPRYSAIDERLADRLVPLAAKTMFLLYVVNTYDASGAPFANPILVLWMIAIIVLFTVELPRVPHGVRVILDVAVVVGLFVQEFFVVCRMIPWSL